MRNVYPAVKHRRFAEYDIFLMNLVLSYQIFDALKPNQVDYPRTVRKVSISRRCRPSPAVSKPKDFTFQLDIRHRTVYFTDAIDAAAVYVFIKENNTINHGRKRCPILIEHPAQA